MARTQQEFFRGVRTTSILTLVSRLLGMVRDMATASLFGLTGQGVADAFVIAFRIPNLFRRLFGEGALAASYLPVLTVKLEEDRRRAWKLASVTLVWLTLTLLGVLILAELVCGGIWLWGGVQSSRMQLLLSLTAIMLPYLVFICLAAQVSATLHALGEFRLPAIVPIILNLSWIFAALVIAPLWSPDKEAQAHVLAVTVVIGGCLQLLIQIPTLRRLGFHFEYDMAASREALGRIVRSLLPMILGLAITQINTLLDSLIALLFSAPTGPDAPTTISWFGNRPYPMEEGAAAAVYYGERLYHFPVGIVGIAVATVIFPLLSRHAARKEHGQIGADLTLGLRMVFFLSIPAAAGLVVLGTPIAQLLFERGEFTALDSARTGAMIVAYGWGAWAYCALPVLVRGCYALDDRKLPLLVGTITVVINLALNLTLIWTLGEIGLATATAMCASLQVIVLALVFSRRHVALLWKSLAATVARSLVATAVMTVVTLATLGVMPEGGGTLLRALRVGMPLALGMLVYLLCIRLLGGSELRFLRLRDKPAANSEP